MSVQQKFDAAVAIVHALPKEGPMKPSDDVRLKFYAYYKQATSGKCDTAQPWMVDVINRAKWDAWNKLGDMTKEVAMQKYAEELFQLIDGKPQEGADSNLKDKLTTFITMMKA